PLGSPSRTLFPYTTLFRSLWIIKGQSDRHTAGLRMADKRGFFEIKGIHEHHDKTSPIGHGIIVWIIGQPKAGLIVGNRAQPSHRQRSEISLENVGRRAE